MLRSGKSKSCGCGMKDATRARFTTHGMSNTKLFKVWTSLKQRCENPNLKWFHIYGGKGVTVCARWRSFVCFLADMGPAPEGASIERIDSTKGYSPDNCCWATPLQQSRNTSRNRLLSHDGVTQCVSEWAEQRGIPRKTLTARLNYGWSVAEALEFVVRGSKNSKRWVV